MKREHDSAERGNSRRSVALPTEPPSDATLPPDVAHALEVVTSAIHAQIRRKHERATGRKQMVRASLRLIKPRAEKRNA